jgi:hypothetical protein
MFEETPQASGLAAGFFFSGSGNQFAAIRIALVRKTGILPRNVSSTFQPRLRPESGAFFLLRSGCFGLGLRVQPLSQAASLQHGGRAKRIASLFNRANRKSKRYMFTTLQPFLEPTVRGL